MSHFSRIKKIKLIAGAIVILCFSANAQINTDSLNKYNEKGKKNGYWIVYLTDRLIPTKDTSQARFYAFNYYDNDVLVGFFPAANSSRKNAKRIDYHGLNPEKGKIILLHGKITYFDRDSISLEENYINGTPQLRQAFFYNKKTKVCKYRQVLDYDHEYKHEKGSFYYRYFDYQDSIEQHNDKSLIEKIWYRKKRKSWRLHYETKVSEYDFDYGPVRYQINSLDRNGKGSSFITVLRKVLKPRLNICYEQTYIADQWLHGANIDFLVINPYSRIGVSVNYFYGFGGRPKNYGFSNEKYVDLLEKGFALHGFFIYRKNIKTSLFLDFLGDNYFALSYTGADGVKRIALNQYWLFKPGIWTTINITKSVGLFAQAYYRWAYYPFNDTKHHEFGGAHDFRGFGFSAGISFK